MRISTVASTIAILFSAYSMWETSLKRAELKVFVPPVIRYASPLQNSNFEVFSIPVTIANE
jgi:PIN domain nuclease of toxin-antitoxin system